MSTNMSINTEIKAVNKTLIIDVKKALLLIYTFYFNTLHTPLNNSNYLLGILLVPMALYYIGKRKAYIYTNIETLWILFIVLVLIRAIINPTKLNVVDIMIYSNFILFLIFMKQDVFKYKGLLQLVKWLSLIYSIGLMIQFFFPGFYLQYFMRLFPAGQWDSMIRLMTVNASYSGLTSQTAYTAGYLANGIGVVFLSLKYGNKKSKAINLLLLIVLFFGVALTGKRGPMIFLPLTLVITNLVGGRKNKYTKIMTIIVVAVVTVLLLSSVMQVVEISESTVFGRMFLNIIRTIEGLISGEDVTTGRLSLYREAWELFLERPIFGIGWRQFSEQSLGIISDVFKSHPHNIYLQVLCELGVVGLILFLVPLTYTYWLTCKLTKIITNTQLPTIYVVAIRYSLYLQTFFILYGITGNLLTDHNFIGMYFLACSITLSVAGGLKNR